MSGLNRHLKIRFIFRSRSAKERVRARRAMRMFHILCHTIDVDYPIRAGTKCTPVCMQCGGVLWNCPRLDDHDLKCLAAQIARTVKTNFTIKIDSFELPEAGDPCSLATAKMLEIPEDLTYPALPAPGGSKAI